MAVWKCLAVKALFLLLTLSMLAARPVLASPDARENSAEQALTPAQRQARSTCVVVADVLGVTMKSAQKMDEHHARMVYEARCKVISVSKGHELKPGADLTCTFWVGNPLGPAKDFKFFGQFENLPGSHHATLYLVGKSGTWELLNPNGWEPAK